MPPNPPPKKIKHLTNQKKQKNEKDDTIAVKDHSKNMLFERIEASGVGLTIGSIGGGSNVNNITFRDCRMHNTYKGKILSKLVLVGMVLDVGTG